MANKAIKYEQSGNTYRSFILEKAFTRHGYILKQSLFTSQEDRTDFEETLDDHYEFDDGDLRLSSFSENPLICYSLNKRKRWEIESAIKRNIPYVRDADFRVSLCERKCVLSNSKSNLPYVNANNWPDCFGYCDSKAIRDVPPSYFSFVTDLRQNSVSNIIQFKKVRKGPRKAVRGVQRKYKFSLEKEREKEIEREEQVRRNQRIIRPWHVKSGHDGDPDVPEVRYQVLYPLDITSRIKICEGIGFFTRENKAWRYNSLCRRYTCKYIRKGKDKYSFGLDINNIDPVEVDELLDDYSSWHDDELDDLDEDDAILEQKFGRSFEVKFADILKSTLSSRLGKKYKNDFKTRHPNSASSKNSYFYGKDRVIYENDRVSNFGASKNVSIERESSFSDTESEISIPLAESDPERTSLPVGTDSEEKASHLCNIYLDSIKEIVNKDEMVMIGNCQPPRILIFLEKQTEQRLRRMTENYMCPSLMVQESLNSYINRPDQHIGDFYVQIHGQDEHSLEKTNDHFRQLLMLDDLLVFRLNELVQLAKDAIKLQQKEAQKEILTRPVRHSRQSSQLKFLEKYHSKCQVMSVTEAYKRLTSNEEEESECKKVLHFHYDGGIKKTTNVFCNICVVSLDEHSEGTSILPCQHFTCNGCLSSYIKEKIQQGALNIECIEYKCRSKIDEVTVMSLITPRLFRRWMRRKVEVAIERSQKWKWCPNAACQSVAAPINPSEASTFLGMPVRCVCSKDWCLDCQGTAHWPLTCKQWQVYQKLLRDRGDFSQSVKLASCFVKVKKCPGCQYPFEKNGGCNVMSCKCGTFFCWGCLHKLGPPAYNHGGPSCNGASQIIMMELTNERLYSHPIKFYLKSVEQRKKWLKLQDNNIDFYIHGLQIKVLNQKMFTWRKFKKKEKRAEIDIRELEDTIVEAKQLLVFVRETYQIMEHVYVVISNGTKKMNKIRHPMLLWANIIEFTVSRLLEMIISDCTSHGIQEKHRKMKDLAQQYLKVLLSQSIILQRVINMEKSRHPVLENPNLERTRYQ